MLTSPPPKGRGFFFQRAFSNSKLVAYYPDTFTPEANTARPAASLLY